MAALKLSFLGTPQIMLDDKPVELSRRRALALLVYLALGRERQRRDTVATLLWPDSSQSRARQALRRDLAILNRELGGRWIDAERESVGLVSGHWLDVEHFERELEAAATSPATRAEHLAAAVALYRDDFLKGFTLASCPEFDEWQFFQTDRLRGAFASALDQLAELLVSQGAVEGAIPYLRRRLALDPLHEAVHRRLMQLYAQAGRRTAALRQYELCRQLLADELGVEPAQETVALYTAVRDRKLSPGDSNSATVSLPAARRHNLPAATTSFIGRRRELADLGQLLEDPAVRLVTILGPGGMGKTRLAQEVARRYLDKHTDRLLFVALAPLQSRDEVVFAMAAAVGYNLLQKGAAAEGQLFDYLAQRQLLLILDNTEHLREGVDLIHAILQAAPGVKILATSRERLQLSAETVFTLGGMSYHQWATVEGALANDTVQLFVQGARRVSPNFTLSANDIAPLAHICGRVGGMPLGILLAAAWVDLLTPAEIADEVNRNQDLLATRLRDVPERQRSIRAIFEYAWRQLGERERTALMKLSLFRGGFTRGAAQAIGDVSLHTLSVLADKSLLQRDVGDRYTIHELLRQYAEAELQASGQHQATADAQRAYYAAFLAQREGDLKGRRQKAALDEIEADFENIRSAWNWSIERGDVGRMAQAFESLGLYYEWRGRFQEGERAFARAAERLGQVDSSDRWIPLARARVWQARFSRGLGQVRDARSWIPETLALVERLDPTEHDVRPERADILNELGHLAYDAGDERGARFWYEHSLALCREMNDRWRQAKVLLSIESIHRNLHGLGNAEEHQRRMQEAQRLVMESLTIFRTLGDHANMAAALYELGVTFLALGQPKDAQPVFVECIALCNELNSHGDTFIDAIGYMGIAKEMMGLYAETRAHGLAILTLAEDLQYWSGLRVSYLLIGGAALAEKAYPEAEHWLAKSVAIARQRGRVGNLSFGLTGLAFASYGLSNRTAARRQLTEALRIAVEIGTIRTAVHGILFAALIQADLGEAQQALELYALAVSFPFAGDSRWCQDVAGRHILTATAALPADVAAAAQEQGRRRDVWKTVAELLIAYAADGPA